MCLSVKRAVCARVVCVVQTSPGCDRVDTQTIVALVKCCEMFPLYSIGCGMAANMAESRDK